MNRADRRAAARRNRSHQTCGCESWGLMVGTLTCPNGHESEFEAWMPTSGRQGDRREAGMSCQDCFEEAEGLVVILELDHR